MVMVFGNSSVAGRGEPGELLLHIVCRQVFGSDVVVNKVFFKTAGNDVIKGFDCVHVVRDVKGELELWLGEAKFYTDRNDAIREAVSSIRAHLSTDYVRGEFALVTDKIDDSWPHAKQVRRLIHDNVPIQNVFRRVTIPVLVSYESETLQAHSEVCASFIDSFEREIRDAWVRFSNGCARSPMPVQVRLVLAPLGSKQALIDELDRRLPGWR